MAVERLLHLLMLIGMGRAKDKTSAIALSKMSSSSSLSPSQITHFRKITTSQLEKPLLKYNKSQGELADIKTTPLKNQVQSKKNALAERKASIQLPTHVRHHPFPVNEFWGPKVINVAASARYLCTVSSSGVRKVCGCNYRCMYTRTCCIDYMWNPKKMKNLDYYLKEFVYRMMRYKDLSCEKIFQAGLKNFGYATPEYLVVSQCKVNHTNAAKCLDRSNQFELPVIGKDNYVYRNRFCAQCNGVSWKPIVKGNYEKLLKAYCRAAPNGSFGNGSRSIEDKDCIYSWRELDILPLHFQRCFNNFCPAESPLYDLCRSYSAPIYGYQNYHCFLCNGGRKLDGRRQHAPPLRPALIPLLYPWSYSIEYINKRITVVEVQMQFPLIKFLGLDMRGIDYLSRWSFAREAYNLWYFLCSNKNNGKYWFQCCSCSETCMETKTCCIDKFWDSKNPPTSLESYITIFLAKAQQSKDLVCAKLLADSRIESKFNGKRLMITGCKNNAHSNNVEKCLNIKNESALDVIEAVLGSDNYLYRNKYCAFCNFVHNFTRVVQLSGCANSRFTIPLDIAMTKNVSSRCSFSITEKNPIVRDCPTKSHPVTSGCDTRNENYALCSSYLGKIESFSNYHCMKCRVGENASIAGQIQQRCARFIKPVEPPSPWSSYLWNSADLFPPSPTPKKPLRLILKIIDGGGFDKCLLARNLSLVVFNYSRQVIDDVTKALQSMKIESSLVYRDKKKGVLEISNKGNISLEDITSRLSSSNAENETFSNMLLIPLSIDPSQLNDSADVSYWYPGGRMCAYPNPVQGKYNFTDRCNVVHNDTEADVTNMTAWIEIHNSIILRKVYTCRIFYLHSRCTLKSLPAEEYILDEKLNLVSRKNNQSVFTPVEYIPQASGYSVCAPNENLFPMWLKSLLKAEGDVSYVGTSLSIVCYICIIWIYLWYKVLRNNGGLIGLTMCCCLLFADSLHLLKTFLSISSFSYPIVCEIVGISIHYALLSAHVWSTILAFDIAYSFAASLPQNRSKSRRYKYLGAGFGAPLLVIMCGIILNYTDFFLLGYGEGNECFITNPNARMVFYTVPVAAMIASNVVMVTFTVIHISRQKKANDDALGQSSRNAVDVRGVAFRLIVTVGLTEVFGFVILPDGIKTLGLIVLRSICNFIYSFLRSIRGILLLVAYLCRGPVVTLVRDSFRNSRNKLASKMFNSSDRSDIDIDDGL